MSTAVWLERSFLASDQVYILPASVCQASHTLTWKKIEKLGLEPFEGCTEAETMNLEEKIEGLMEKIGDIWRCVVCGKVAEDSKARGNLKRHVETHIEGVTHHCDICGHTSTSSGGLYQHKAKKHSELRPDKIFRKKQLAMGVISQLQPIPNPIPNPHHDGSLTINMEELEEKISQLIDRQGDKLMCMPCGKTMPLEKKWAIRRHAEVHLEGMAFPCDTCGKVTV